MSAGSRDMKLSDTSNSVKCASLQEQRWRVCLFFFGGGGLDSEACQNTRSLSGILRFWSNRQTRSARLAKGQRS